MGACLCFKYHGHTYIMVFWEYHGKPESCTSCLSFQVMYGRRSCKAADLAWQLASCAGLAGWAGADDGLGMGFQAEELFGVF